MMKQDHTIPNQGDDLKDLESNLETVDAADAPDVAEEIARRLGTALDDIDGANRSTVP
jgi:hypothetical protein